jgi:hypothetical protein
VATWYAAAEHGNLANHKPAFPAFLQLLNDGRTGQLPTSPPATARGVRAKIPYVPQSVLYPTEAEFVAGLLGGSTSRYTAGKAVGFKVSVVHGDLRHARFAVMAGHYEGDTIAGAEGYLDRRLDGALSQRYGLGIYPGALGTNTVVLRAPGQLQKELGIPRGAVIIGLGSMGELSPATLANAIRRGALDYVALVEDQCGWTDGEIAARSQQETGLSVLLIGTNSSASITVEDSVSALLRAIGQANHEIANTKGLATRISEIEIVELYADVAIHAAHAVKELASDVESELDVRIEAADLLRQGQGGEVRVTPSLSRDQWRRWISPRRGGVPRRPCSRHCLPHWWSGSAAHSRIRHRWMCRPGTRCSGWLSPSRTAGRAKPLRCATSRSPIAPARRFGCNTDSPS